ncbi:MAG: MFS transporter [Pseudomonadota bacterium]
MASALSVFRHRAYLHYWIMRQLVSASRQMGAVAIGFHIYGLARETRSVEESALLLGFVGLAQFLPVFFLSLLGGQIADTYNRKIILVIVNVVRLAAYAILVTTPLLATETAIWTIFAMAALLGVTNAFSPAAANALYPNLVPREDIRQAIAINSIGFQVSSIAGPAIGGFLYILGPDAVYSTCTVMSVLASLAIATARTPAQQKPTATARLELIIEGLRFIWSNKLLLGAISLDLVVVLFAGATALLPIFAKEVLGVGAEGLGVLRAAPAVGAALVAVTLAYKPLTRKSGAWMLWSIGVYGAATLVFGLSTLFWVSLIALAVSGAADMISVYVRQSIVQLTTPDTMRGRVSSVSFIFVSASNELGEFESGVAARFLGPVGAVVLGGAMAVFTAAIWPKVFPALARVDEIKRPDD